MQDWSSSTCSVNANRSQIASNSMLARETQARQYLPSTLRFTCLSYKALVSDRRSHCKKTMLNAPRTGPYCANVSTGPCNVQFPPSSPNHESLSSTLHACLFTLPSLQQASSSYPHQMEQHSPVRPLLVQHTVTALPAANGLAALEGNVLIAVAALVVDGACVEVDLLLRLGGVGVVAAVLLCGHFWFWG